MSKTTTPRAKTSFEIRTIDENTWRATVIRPNGRMYVCDYAPSDEKNGANPDGSPTIAMVKEAWKDEPSAFREV